MKAFFAFLVMASLYVFDSSASSRAGSKATEAPHEIHWSYDGENGPEHWSEKSKDYNSCKTGTTQSPVNIRNTR